MSLGCFEEFNMKGSMCSYRPYIGHWCGRLLKAVLYLTPIKFELFRETEWHSGSKLELPSCKLALEFCKKTKRFSIGKQLKTGCPGPPKISKMGGTEKGLILIYFIVFANKGNDRKAFNLSQPWVVSL